MERRQISLDEWSFRPDSVPFSSANSFYLCSHLAQDLEQRAPEDSGIFVMARIRSLVNDNLISWDSVQDNIATLRLQFTLELSQRSVLGAFCPAIFMV
jgi:hypothetical protein